MRRLVYLLAWPPDRFDVERYGLRTAAAQGLEVEAFDLSPLLNPDIARPPLDPAENALIRRISSLEELDEHLRRTADDAAYVDFMLGLANLDAKHERVFRLLRRRGCRLLLVSAGALPLPRPPGRPAAAAAHRLRQAVDPRKLRNFIATRLLIGLRRHTSLYPRPAVIFGGRSESVAAHLRRHDLSPEIVVPIHSLDYDRYLSYRRGTPVPEATDGSCVFLDEGATSHPDFAALGLAPLAGGPYFRALNEFFSGLENETGLRVVVAAHPRADYARIPKAFGDRPVIAAKTVELVARAELVLTHASTALSFAVLMGKPLRLLQTPEMRGTPYEAQIQATAAALDTSPMLAGGPWGEGLDWTSFSSDAYADYRAKYLQTPGVPDRTVWEIVAERVKCLK